MRETANGSRAKRESRHARGRRSSARSLGLPFLEEKYSSYIQVRFKDKVFRGTVFNFFFTGEFNFKILNDFFFRSLLYTGPVPVYNYSQGQIVGGRRTLNWQKKIAQRKERGEELLPKQMAASVLASYWRQKTFVRGSSPRSLLFFCPL